MKRSDRRGKRQKELGIHIPELPEDWIPKVQIMLAETNSEAWKQVGRPLRWGRMFAAHTPIFEEGEPWGFDNGAWTFYSRGLEWDGEWFLRRIDDFLEKVEELKTPPLVAVVPDIILGGMESFDRSQEWVEKLQHVDWPWYLVVQDGMSPSDPEIFEALSSGFYAGIFMGTVPTSSARKWVSLARKLDLRFHYARCGVIGKLQHAYQLGVDSVDSSGPLRSWRILSRYVAYWWQMERMYE